jgi:hypothetical protein
MIECIFTIDYEIYGNGTGSLKDLVYDPAEQLIAVFKKQGARCVLFVEVAEFERIEVCGTDEAIGVVKRQIRECHKDGFELGLHLHPQWYKARFEAGRWLLDYREYNLCRLERSRIEEIVERAVHYLSRILDEPDFVPLSFRAGNWLFQPTQTAAAVLAKKGIELDSSVFKGGLQHNNDLDYRPAMKNGYYWKFRSDVNIEDSNGFMLEIPIYSEMVPFWRMCTAKRLSLQQKGTSSLRSHRQRLYRALDFIRFWYPLKFDFCRMKLAELTSMMDIVIRDDQKNPQLYKPVVLIGHTKDLLDLDAVDSFLTYLKGKGLRVSTFQDVIEKCRRCGLAALSQSVNQMA